MHLGDEGRTVRFAVASSLPPLLVLSLAATARNIYLAPALPGAALLLAWWAREVISAPDAWDVRALRATAVMLLLSVFVFAVALIFVALDSWSTLSKPAFLAISVSGMLLAAWLAIRAWTRAHSQTLQAQLALFLAYCALLVAPASQIYTQVDEWQDLGKISREIQLDAGEQRLVLLAPDETTTAVLDMYAPGTAAQRPPRDVAPDVSTARQLAGANGVILTQLQKIPLKSLQRFRPASITEGDLPAWIAASNLRLWKEYALPNGRRYALLKNAP